MILKLSMTIVSPQRLQMTIVGIFRMTVLVQNTDSQSHGGNICLYELASVKTQKTISCRPAAVAVSST